MEHIIDWFKNEASSLFKKKKNEPSSAKLRVVSIVGPGGLGKTTLTNQVFQIMKEEFSCAAFVSVSRKPDMKNVLRAIAEKVGITHVTSSDDEQRLIERLREHLQEKRYLVVIDDIWSEKAWETIKDALPNNDSGSRIITATRDRKLASFCSQGYYVYEMKPLSSDDSERLFRQRAFGSEASCPPHLKKVFESILEKCAGLPLAIITMSSLLSDQTAEEVWNRALAAVGSSLAKEDGAAEMTKILSLSYFDLPHYMRACLLYLSAYPEDHIIEKKSLIHKWMAEGFIREEERRSTYEVGESYFNDFINRSLIEPVEGFISDGEVTFGEVEACRVHDIILDFITCKAKEENFMTSFGDAEHGGKHKVRRLSVVNRDNGMATVSMDLSHVRSLAVFRYAWRNLKLDFPALRVLDLEGFWDLKNDHFANIEKLLLLKYLRLGRSSSFTEIPEGIGKLKFLETLDMRGLTIRKLPSTMAQLQRLARLYAIFELDCLSDGIIGQLRSLEELEKVVVPETQQEKFLQELGQLTKLRTLSVHVRQSKLSKNVDNVRCVGTLISSYNLHHLTITYRGNCLRGYPLSLESWRPANPAALRKICIRDYCIGKVPSWLILLGNLRVLCLSEMYRTVPEDMAILGGMPALVALKLDTWYGKSGNILVLPTGFGSLKYFDLRVRCCGTTVEFGEGSMPKLEHLELEFSAHFFSREKLSAHLIECVNYGSDFGIQHLSALTTLEVCIHGDKESTNMIRMLIETALVKLRHRPSLSWKSQDRGMCRHFETALTHEWEKLKECEEENGEGGGPCSFLAGLLEEIKQDIPCLRLMGMLRSLDDIVKSLCTAATPAADESVAIASALSEIQREMSAADAITEATAFHRLSAISRRLLASPAAAAAPNGLVLHLAHDMNYRRQVCQLADKNAVRVRDILSQRLANMSSNFGGTLSFPKDEQRFENFFPMKRRTFKYICCLAKSIEDVSSDTFLDGRAMCLEDQVAVSLRMLISGGPLETVASDFSISESIVSVVTCRFVEAMMMRASYHERWPDSIEMEKIKSKFELIFGLPNCCGVIDTTYITRLRLSSVESNRENEIDYIMAVQVVVDPDMRFTNVHVEWPGREGQWRIVRDSLIPKQREKGVWLTGSKLETSDGSEVGEYIIGDAGYDLLPWLLTPYRGKRLSDPSSVEFNRRLSAARDVTLRGLARLKDTWKCLHGKLRPENRQEFGKVIRVCCMLHNIVIDMEGKAMEEEYVPNRDVKYTDVSHYDIPDENAVRTRDVLSQHLASRSSKSIGDEEEQVVPSDAGDEEEQEASRRKAQEETHCLETVLTT